MPDEGGRGWVAGTLRQLRTAAKVSQIRAAHAIGRNQARISRLEKGDFVPTDGEIRTLTALYKASAATRRGLLQAAGDLRAETIPARVIMSRGGWKMQARVKRIEKATAEVCVFQPLLIPGLLQTEDYMRLVFSDGGDMPPADVAKAVELRMSRADILDSDRAFVFVIPEGALRWQAGSPEIMTRQLAHITEVAASRPNVRIGVIPQAQPADVFPTHGFSLYDRRTVMVGLRTGTSFISDPRDLADYSKLFGELEALAQFGESAQVAIATVAEGYRR